METYAKLSSKLITSSLWATETPEAKVLWITLLAMKDRSGNVSGTVPGLARMAGISIEDTEAAIERFQQQDLLNRTDDGCTLVARLAEELFDRNPTRRRDLLTAAWNRVRQKVLRRDKYTCQYCGFRMRPGHAASVDHVVPYSKGGGDEESNLVAACRPCNGRKKDRDASWMEGE